MIANHPIYGNTCAHLVATLICLSQNYSYYIRGDISQTQDESTVPGI